MEGSLLAGLLFLGLLAIGRIDLGIGFRFFSTSIGCLVQVGLSSSMTVL